MSQKDPLKVIAGAPDKPLIIGDSEILKFHAMSWRTKREFCLSADCKVALDWVLGEGKVVRPE